MFEYNAIITSVYDADTLTADIDLGMGVWNHGVKLRLYGINAWEVRRNKAKGIDEIHVAKGKAGRFEVLEIVNRCEGKVVVQTIRDKKGKFGRWLARIWVPIDAMPRPDLVTGIDVNGDILANLNEWLVTAGHAWEREY